MVDFEEGNKKAIFIVLILIIAGASFYLGFYLGEGESTAAQSNQSDIQAIQSTNYSLLLITSPKGDAEDRIIELIQTANRSIDVEMYSFTNLDLANALIEAKKRGVYVRVILDPLQNEADVSKGIILDSNGVEVRKAPSNFKITHSKIMVVDGVIVLIGSHNWSLNAMFYNREMSVIIHDSNLASQIEGIFNSDWEKSSELP